MTEQQGLLVVIAGPSGVGKGTVHRRLRARLDDAWLSVSVTTRSPRPGERDGVDYYFVDEATFRRMVDRGELYEWARYAGRWYGTPAAPIRAAVARGQVVLLDIEVDGALQVKSRDPSALLVFLVPPSMDELQRRLERRGTEDAATIASRLAIAVKELEHVDAFDVQVVNDDLERCVEAVHAAITERRLRTA